MNIKIKLHHLLIIGAMVLGSCQKEYVQKQPPTPPPTSVSYSLDIAPAFAATTSGCLGSSCHNAGVNPPDLSTPSIAYTALKTGTIQSSSAGGPAYCDTVNPTNSVFYRRIHLTTPDDQMPVGASALSADYQAKVLKWIQDGAKNN
ncbi:MAG: hypothetical protein HY841_07675 [Bacteroidetes bacterium]|nr:hypothetical protein [Bacteroidota bacterium]